MSQSAGKRHLVLADLNNKNEGTAKTTYYLDTAAVEETNLKEKMRSERARKAQKTTQAKYRLGGGTTAVVAPLRAAVEEPIFPPPTVTYSLAKDMAATRRKALEYFFVHIYGAPEPDVWLRDGVVSSISHQLQISQGSSAEVKKVFLDILAARAAQKKYDEHAGAKLRGRKPTIVDCTPQAEVVYSAF
jgi:hypothetical protein